MTVRRRAVPVRALGVAGLLLGLVLTCLPAPVGAAAPAGRSGQDGSSAAGPQRTPAAQVVTSRGRAAVRWATNRSHYPTRRCIVFVRSALRVPGRYPTPRVAWAHARHRHRTPYRAIPAGVPVYSVGRTAPGHVVLSLGNGKVRSTDWPRPGRVGTVRLAKLLRTWNHRYLGWSEDLNGVRVWHR